jgi:hypothetical protein
LLAFIAKRQFHEERDMSKAQPASSEPKSLDDLLQLESLIRSTLSPLPLDGVLLALRRLPLFNPETRHGVHLHVIATAARFAVQCCQPGPMNATQNVLNYKDTDALIGLANTFAHADPCGWLGQPSDPLLPMFLRLVGNQFNFKINQLGKWARADILFNDLPVEIRGKADVPAFDFHAKFEAMAGVSFSDFIDVGYVAFSAAASAKHLGFTRGYFEKAKQDGFTLPDDSTIKQVLSHYAAPAAAHSEICERFKQRNRDYAANDFNSLFVHPLVRPWPVDSSSDLDSDRMIAPIPSLILDRMTSGTYYAMREHYKEPFDRYFGHLLSAYVGKILSGSVASENLLSEADVRHTYSAAKGKVPDWIIISDRTAILIEVKVARVKRKVYATGDQDVLNQNLEAVADGLRQMHEFSSAVKRKAPGLERLSRCKTFSNILVTLEPTHLSASEPFKE